MATTSPDTARKKRERHRLLYRLEAELEPIMFMLAIAWLWLFIVELFFEIRPWQERAMVVIWVAFIVEFLLKLYLAPRRLRYILHNWLTVLALAVPAFRAFRILRALRVLRVARVTSVTRMVRALTSSRRLYRDIQEAQGAKSEPEMNVGMLVMASPNGNTAMLEKFAMFIARPVSQAMESASGLRWNFHSAAPRQLDSENAKLPSDFLDEASMGMAQGPYDMVVVVTDVILVSRNRKVQEGLASSTARIAVISTRNLAATPRGETLRELDSPPVQLNGSALLLHLVGHLAGLDHRRGSEVMQSFVFRASRRGLPQFTRTEHKALERISASLPERELHGRATLAELLFHLLMAIRHPVQLVKPLLRSKAILLPLSLPGLATAAVAPSFLLVFTAEIWDVGLGMSNTVASVYALLSVIGASLFLANVQSLFLPRKNRNVLTEHLAVANASIFLSILLMCVGLFLIVAALMLVIEIFIFPAGLVQTWPTLDQPAVTLADKLRLSAFIATVGVSTGALAGGFESRTMMQNLALFEDER